jgi:protein-L-isoaspartate(D-aspartate) O-methyltransferase
MSRLSQIALLTAVVDATGCRSERDAAPPTAPTAPAPVIADADATAAARNAMVDETIAARGITDARVLAAMRVVPRHELVPEPLRARAYDDRALPIGFDQTISQPYVVAAMTEAAQIAPGERVLEIGTGSGYQAAVLAEMGAEVYSIEIVEPLARRTHDLLARLGYTQLHLKIGDGYRGWPDAAPFAAILVTAAPPEIPKPLIDQLAIGGRMVIPVGGDEQHLKVVTRGPDGTTTETLFAVMFVPMTGEAQDPPDLDARPGP